jgi:hypothetical protein
MVKQPTSSTPSHLRLYIFYFIFNQRGFRHILIRRDSWTSYMLSDVEYPAKLVIFKAFFVCVCQFGPISNGCFPTQCGLGIRVPRCRASLCSVYGWGRWWEQGLIWRRRQGAFVQLCVFVSTRIKDGSSGSGGMSTPCGNSIGMSVSCDSKYYRREHCASSKVIKVLIHGI